MTPFLLLLAQLIAEPPATLQMSIDLAHPGQAGTVRVQIQSLADGTTRTSEHLSALGSLYRETLAPGSYELTIEAAHHRPVTRRFTARAGETVALGVVGLPALPVIRGRVVGGDGQPLAGARVRLPPAGPPRTVDAKGVFAIEVDARRPEYLIVSAPRHGTRAVAVPAGSTDLLLPDIALGPPAKLTVAVERPAGPKRPLQILIGETAPQKTPRWIDERALPANEATATFAGLASGTYTLLVRGNGPLEQLATPVVLGVDDSMNATVRIEPMPVEARVVLGRQPLPKARLRLTHFEHGYKAAIDTDDAGTWRGESWQRGAWIARLTAPSVRTAVTVETTLAAQNWIVKLPEISVRGQVLDAATGEPLAKARVSLESESEDSSATVTIDTGADGRFEYRSVPAGTQTLHVRLPGYLYTVAPPFALTEDGSEKEVVVRLDRGVRKELRVVDSHEAPVARATVLAAVDDRVVSSSVTGEDGRTTVALPREDAVLYVVPENAPFAVLRVAAGNADARLRVTIPRAQGMLEMATRTENGSPVADVRVLFRYNGELVPPEVARSIQRAQGSQFFTDATGVATLRMLPLGVYELWPYRTDSEAEQLMASATALTAPIHLTLKTGENRVTVKFRAR